MSKIFFNPFVGRDYANGGIFGRSIMVLGESHYCDEECADCGSCSRHPECMNFTNDVVTTYLRSRNGDVEGENWMKTFLKFERSLVGHETTGEDSKRIWNSVLFFNYLQVAMGETRQAGTNEQYRQAEDALFEMFEQYRPECVIVWGKRLFGKLPEKGWQDRADIVVDDYHIANGVYMPYGAKVMAVYHPSVGYSWDYWHKAIKEFMK